MSVAMMVVVMVRVDLQIPEALWLVFANLSPRRTHGTV
jgi:hypothetical protein